MGVEHMAHYLYRDRMVYKKQQQQKRGFIIFGTL